MRADQCWELTKGRKLLLSECPRQPDNRRYLTRCLFGQVNILAREV